MPLGRLTHAAAATDLIPLLYSTNALNSEQAKPQNPCQKIVTSSDFLILESSYPTSLPPAVGT